MAAAEDEDKAWLLAKEPAATLEDATALPDGPWLVVSMRLNRRETERYEDVVGDARLEAVADDVVEGEAEGVFGIDPVAELLLADNIDVEAAMVEAGMEDCLNVDTGDDDDTTTTTTEEDDD